MLLYINFVVPLPPPGCYVHPSDVLLGPKIDIASFPQPFGREQELKAVYSESYST